eukprot:6246932-Pyramimonas_sp.AAC.1
MGESNSRVTRWLNKVLTVGSTVSVTSPTCGHPRAPAGGRAALRYRSCPRGRAAPALWCRFSSSGRWGRHRCPSHARAGAPSRSETQHPQCTSPSRSTRRRTPTRSTASRAYHELGRSRARGGAPVAGRDPTQQPMAQLYNI